ncbi:CHAT domain-containing protein [Iningainema tapete]|uniref:VMAP-C domain-containing protein n=1 Tax=Iningainema tapete TaxID=2806730 RepID=UPI00192DDA2C|nr:CHAT domain-containing protein [Iningainema tapete]
MLGEALFDMLFDDVLLHDFVVFYNEVVQAKQQLLRVELDIDERIMPEVAALPWEFMCVPQRANLGTIWIATVPQLVFSRRRSQWIPAKPIQLNKNEKLRIALVVSAPANLGSVDYQPVETALEKLAAEAQQVELLPVVNPANPETIDAVLTKKPHIFHFIGHGCLKNENNQQVGKIALVEDWGDAMWVDADYFGELFNQHRPGVVMLQACEGAMLSASQAFVGVASSVVQQNIPVVVAMQYEVSNSTASRFARRFYAQLAQDDPVDIAAQYGRRTIALNATQYRKRDFATPVIFMRVPDGYLFKAERENENVSPSNDSHNLELTGSVRKQLREALLDAFPTEGNFEMMLKEELDQDFNQIARGESYEQKLFYLIQDLKAKNQIRELINAVRRANPGNIKLLNFSKNYSNHFTDDNLSKLKLILDKIDFKLVKDAYLKTLPKGAAIDNREVSNPKDIESIIQILLKDYPKTNSDIPTSIIELAQRLANQKQGDDRKYQDLENWLEQVIAKLDIKLPDISKEEYDYKQLQSYLLIIVYPESKNFRLEAEFILDERQKPQPEPVHLEELLNFAHEDNDRKGILCDSFEKISEQLDRIIRAFIDKHPEVLDLTIEIFLSYKYLSQNIDELWKIKNDFKYITIVSEFNFIVHPIERITGTYSLRNLRQGWNRLIVTLNENHSQDIIMKKIKPISKKDERNWSKIANDLKEKIGLKLTSPLSRNSKDQEIFFQTILSGGVPIAFWTRDETPPHLKLEEQIDCHLTIDCLNNNLRKLIDEICRIRKEAYCEENPQNYLGYHLGFLCDNPHRIPKIKNLKLK